MSCATRCGTSRRTSFAAIGSALCRLVCTTPQGANKNNDFGCVVIKIDLKASLRSIWFRT